jgi:hypothetical protein
MINRVNGSSCNIGVRAGNGHLPSMKHLIWVPDHKRPRPGAPQERHQCVLRGICVLELINQNVPPPAGKARTRVREGGTQSPRVHSACESVLISV